MSLILALETSCDETAVAITRGAGEILASEISSQIEKERQAEINEVLGDDETP